MHNSRIPHVLHQNNNPAEYNLRGVQAMLRKAHREASYFFLSAVVCDPEHWPAFFNLGNCWAKLGEEDAALWAYEQAVPYCDHYAPLYTNLGILHCRLGQPEEALPYLEKAVSLNGETAKCAAALGYVCYRLGELGMAWHWYSKAQMMEPDNSAVLAGLQVVGEKIAAVVQ